MPRPGGRRLLGLCAGEVRPFIYGRYPFDERWRVNSRSCSSSSASCRWLIPRVPYKRETVAYLLVVFPVLAFILLTGKLGLAPVRTELWGGLMVTLVVAIVGIAGSLPLGILLALGRRSKLPIIRYFCIAFIEFWRGVPLITVLFMASVMLPLFLPPGTTFDKLLRALDRRGAVLLRLHGGGRARRPAGDPARPVRGGVGARPRLLADDAPDHPAAGAEDRHPRHRQHASSASSRTRASSSSSASSTCSAWCRLSLDDQNWATPVHAGDRLRLRGVGLLDLLLRHVPLFAVHGAPAEHRPQALGACHDDNPERRLRRRPPACRRARRPQRRRRRHGRRQQVVRRFPRAARHQSQGAARRAHRHLRAVRLGQVDDDPLHQPAGGAPEGRASSSTASSSPTT